jgi:hypothetical protein
MGDLRRLLKEGPRPPVERMGELVKMSVAAGEFWRCQASGAKR